MDFIQGHDFKYNIMSLENKITTVICNLSNVYNQECGENSMVLCFLSYRIRENMHIYSIR